MQVLSRKFKVIEENRTKPSSLLSVFLQTDQMWPLMWSSGFHFCLLRFSSQRSTFDGYFLNDKYVKRVKIQPWTTNGTQRRVKLICYMTSDCLQQYNLSSAWNQKEKTQQSFVVQEVVWGLKKQSIEHGIRFMTPIRSCIAESTDNSRPRDLYWCSLGMFLVSFLYERKCLRIDLLKINCCLNVPFNIWFLYVLNR